MTDASNPTDSLSLHVQLFKARQLLDLARASADSQQVVDDLEDHAEALQRALEADLDAGQESDRRFNAWREEVEQKLSRLPVLRI